MNISKIEDNLQEVLSNFTAETFIYDLLGAYGKPKAAITRLQKGDYNLSKKDGEILWKKNLFFKNVNGTELHTIFDQVSQSEKIIKYDPRFIIVSDFQTVLALDTKTADKLDIPFKSLAENFDFFLPLAGHEKISCHKENAADIKAAERMAKIYDEICKNNPGIESNDVQALNVFLSRLLFCFFAESTQIFKQNLFIQTIDNRTKEDGSDLHQYFNGLFDLLNTPEKDRHRYQKYLNAFPYVNGGLFKDKYKIPQFSHKLRKMIVECGKMDWSVINPDIFGSMIQAVANPNQRSNLGMHYTSVTNIMKVIQPLFLNALYEEFELHKNNKKKLEELYERLGRIKIFDPACGSGNFLIIAYKELRQFEIQLLKRLEEMGRHPTFLSKIQLYQFYGVEIDTFACEIAKLSLWIAEHQMNVVFKNTFGNCGPSLPLKEGGRIERCNAIQLDWEKICPKDEKSEIYLLGNPPYQGARKQSIEQKMDIATALIDIESRNNLDYVSCWVIKAAKYISGSSARAAFVTTNSITQGNQVPILWPQILKLNVEIGFAYTSFKWTNNVKNNAGVYCVIIGLRNTCCEGKFIYENNLKKSVNNISGYLSISKDVFVEKRRKPLSRMPKMVFGSMPNDGGFLLLSSEEKNEIIKEYPASKKFIRKIIGAEEFIDDIEKFCIWIDNDKLEDALKIIPIRERIEKVRIARNGSKRAATKKLAALSYRFAEIRHVEKNYILVPSITSEARDYIPIGFISPETIANNRVHIIYDADFFYFGVLSSKMHNLWTKSVAGRLEMRIIYSAEICYNNFPFPEINRKQKEVIDFHVRNIISEREKYPEKSIADLYNPKKMPKGLRDAHEKLDAAIERCYRPKPFESDEERLEYLFKLYEEMIQKERNGKKYA